MGNVVVINRTNIIINVALCLGRTRYYESNYLQPNYQGTWTGVGSVWFTIVRIPWFGPDSEFGDCETKFLTYTKRLPGLAQEIEKTGSGMLGWVKVVGRNVTRFQAEERLRNLASWGDGHKVIGCALDMSGGPPPGAVSQDPRVIDITNNFNPVTMHIGC